MVVFNDVGLSWAADVFVIVFVVRSGLDLDVSFADVVSGVAKDVQLRAAVVLRSEMST